MSGLLPALQGTLNLGAAVQALLPSPKGERMAVLAADGAMALVSTLGGPVLPLLGPQGQSSLAAWRSDGQVLATWAAQEGLAWWSSTGRFLGSLPWAFGPCLALAFGPTGDALLALEAEAVHLHQGLNTYVGARLWRSWAHPGARLAALAWAADGASFWVGGLDHLAVHAPERDAPLWVQAFPGRFLSFHVCPTGRWLVGRGRSNSLTAFGEDWLHDAPGRQGLRMEGHGGLVSCVAWDAWGKVLASAGSAELLLWDFRGHGPKNRKAASFRHHEKPLLALAFAPEGELLASLDEGGHLAIWRPFRGPDLLGKRPILATSLPGAPNTLAWLASTASLLVGDASGDLSWLAWPAGLSA